MEEKGDNTEFEYAMELAIEDAARQRLVAKSGCACGDTTLCPEWMMVCRILR